MALSKPCGCVGTTGQATAAAYVLPLGYSICRRLSAACSLMILAAGTDRVAWSTPDSGPGAGRLMAGSVQSSELTGLVLLLRSICLVILREGAVPPGVVVAAYRYVHALHPCFPHSPKKGLGKLKRHFCSFSVAYGQQLLFLDLCSLRSSRRTEVRWLKLLFVLALCSCFPVVGLSKQEL